MFFFICFLNYKRPIFGINLQICDYFFSNRWYRVSNVTYLRELLQSANYLINIWVINNKSFKNMLNNSRDKTDISGKFITIFSNELKGCLCCIFASLFLSLKKSTGEKKKNVFYFTSKPFSFSRKSSFRIPDIQI